MEAMKKIRMKKYIYIDDNYNEISNKKRKVYIPSPSHTKAGKGKKERKKKKEINIYICIYTYIYVTNYITSASIDGK